MRPSESHAPRRATRASPEVQLRQRRQPLKSPRHSRPALLPEAIAPAAGEGGGISSMRSGCGCGMRMDGDITFLPNTKYFACFKSVIIIELTFQTLNILLVSNV